MADYILEHPQAPLTLSIGELAEEAGTSAATVTRFCRMIGYAGYVELRVSIATDVGRSTALDSWTTEIGRAFGPDDSPEDLLSMLISSHTRTLREATSAIDLGVMTRVSRRIALSPHVDIYGVGGSAMLAEELQGRLYRIGINAYAWAEVHIGLTSAAIQDAEHRGHRHLHHGPHRGDDRRCWLRPAAAGALTVAITNNPTSPLAELADRSIVTSIYEQFLQPDDLSAKHGQLLVLDLLYLPGRPGELRPVEREARRVRLGRVLPSPPAAHDRRGGRPPSGASGTPVRSRRLEAARREDRSRRCRAPLHHAGPRRGVEPGLDAWPPGRRRRPRRPRSTCSPTAIERGAVIQAFGTGHSEAFAMEIAGRAGGLIPTNKIALRDLVLHGSRSCRRARRRHSNATRRSSAELWEISPIQPGDVFVIASNSGVNGSIVGLALLAKQKGHQVIAVTSLQHTMQVQPKHPSGGGCATWRTS